MAYIKDETRVSVKTVTSALRDAAVFWIGLSIKAWCSCLLGPCAVVCECSHQCALGPSPWLNCVLQAFFLRSVILLLASNLVHRLVSQISPMSKLTLHFERITSTISYLVVKSAHQLTDSSVYPARLWRQTDGYRSKCCLHSHQDARGWLKWLHG